MLTSLMSLVRRKERKEESQEESTLIIRLCAGADRETTREEDEFVSRISRGSSEHVLLPFQSRKEFKIGDMVLSMQLIFWG